MVRTYLYKSIFFLLLILSEALTDDRFSVKPSSCGIGQILTISCGPDVRNAFFLGKEYTLFDDGTGRSVMIGIGLKTLPGKYELMAGSNSKTVEIFEPDYPSEKLSVNSDLASKTRTLSDESGMIVGVLGLATAERLYWQEFIWPLVIKTVSSPFGSKRVYNDGLLAWQHKGTDLVNKPGSPVIASNSGKVAFSKKLKIHGNTIIIDHGRGIFTLYNHLDKRLVRKGQIMKRGQLIGTLGDTGMVTGPHLHFGLSVYGERVDPSELLGRPQVPSSQKQ